MGLEVEKHTLPNGDIVEFYPTDHQYVCNGAVLPSVTTLLKQVYGDVYAAVDPELLKRSADYGTQVHSELQSLITARAKGADIWGMITSPTMHQETINYFVFVEPIYKIKPVMVEKVVLLYDKNKKAVAAGRFDLLAEVGGVTTLCDFKTTSAIHGKMVRAQLNLYLKAAVQSGYLSLGQKYNLAAIHLSGEICRMIPIPVLGDVLVNKFIEN